MGLFLRTATAGGLTIYGTIVNAHGDPLSGCLVSIASEENVRSKGVFTEEDGSFEVLLGGTGVIPYLEVYWDQQLAFRQRLTRLEIEPSADSPSYPTELLWQYFLRRGGQVKLKPIKVGLP